MLGKAPCHSGLVVFVDFFVIFFDLAYCIANTAWHIATANTKRIAPVEIEMMEYLSTHWKKYIKPPRFNASSFNERRRVVNANHYYLLLIMRTQKNHHSNIVFLMKFEIEELLGFILSVDVMSGNFFSS